METKSDNASDILIVGKLLIVLLFSIFGPPLLYILCQPPDPVPILYREPDPATTDYHRYVAYVQIINVISPHIAIMDNLVKIPTDDVNICKYYHSNPNVGSCHIRPVNSYDYSTRANPEIAGDHGEF